MQQWVTISSAVVCSVFSAIFSGLTIGFMSLDIFQLHLLTHVDPQTPEDVVSQRRAKKVLPLRRDANYLLVTLLACNSMINAALVLFIGDIFDFTFGFIISSVIITILGEILPQAIFFNYQLQLCAFFSFFTRCVQILLFPITKPLSILLTLLIGSSSQIIYNRQQLKALVDLQSDVGDVISNDEAKLLKGCLNLSLVSAKTIMTPIESVYGLTVDTVITPSVINEIAHTGYTKIPILDRSKSQCILGFLLVKDLLLIDTSSSYKISDLLQTIGKPTYAVDSTCGILTVLSHFKEDSTHIAAVRDVDMNNNSGDPIYSHIGIITMDDIFQVILHEGLEDNTERIELNRSSSIARMNQRSTLYKSLITIKDPRSFTLNSILNIFPITNPELVLETLGLSTCKENLDKLSKYRVYLIKKQIVIPNHPLTIVLKGTVTNLNPNDTSYKWNQETPFIINDNSKPETSKNVFVTSTECELIQLDSKELFNVKSN